MPILFSNVLRPSFVSAAILLLALSSCQTGLPTLTDTKGLNPSGRLKIQARRGRLHCPPGALNCNPQDMTLPDEDKFILPPEYTQTQAVMVSDKLMEYQGSLQLLQALIQSGSDVWMLSRDQNLFQSSQNMLKFSLSPLGFPLSQTMFQLPIATDSIWSRDYGPISTFPDTNYQGPKLDYKLMNSFYYPERFQDDRVPASLSRVLNSPVGPLSQQRVFTSQLNLALEGGNLMCTDTVCFASDKVIERNLGQDAPTGQTWTSVADIQAEFASQFQQPVNFVSALPGEGTGHIDMWAKFLNKDTLLIGQISDQSLASAGTKDGRLNQIQAFLEQQATGMDAEGHIVDDSLYQQAKQANPNLKVIRIPMPLPMLNDAEFSVFRSYTNALIVNQTVLIPQYRSMPDGSAYPDSGLLNQYEQAVQKAYESTGYSVKWIPSDQWIAMGGAVHCVTMQIPENPTAT